MAKKQLCGPWKATRSGWKRSCRMGDFRVMLQVMSKGAWATMTIPDLGVRFGGRAFPSADAAKRALDRAVEAAAKMHRV